MHKETSQTIKVLCVFVPIVILVISYLLMCASRQEDRMLQKYGQKNNNMNTIVYR